MTPGFEFTHELAWNLLKNYLTHQGIEAIIGWSRRTQRRPGQRIEGRHRPASDIDLTLVGAAISAHFLAAIDADLDDLPLPWVLDLSCLESINPPALLTHIERMGHVKEPGAVAVVLWTSPPNVKTR
jgi:hypothetical protein